MLNYQGLFNTIIFGLLLLTTSSTFAQPSSHIPERTDREPSENTFTPSSSEKKPKKKISTGARRIRFKPASNDKQPKNTTSGGSRGDRCLQDISKHSHEQSLSTSSSLISIVPTQSNFGQTVAEYPTFWIYLPQTSARKVVLSIKTEKQTHHSQTIIPINRKSGIVSFQPNLESPPLEIGKNYQWSVVLVCGNTPSPNDPAIASWVRRVAASKKIEGTALEQASEYAEQGIWYDALSSLAQARKSQPNNQELIDIWTEFLESGGLKGVPAEPLQ